MKRNYYTHYNLKPIENTALKTETSELSGVLGNIISGFKIDDLILIAVIIILATDEKPDLITIFALVYILFA